MGGTNDLFTAVQSGNVELVREILVRQPGAVTERDQDGATALHYASEIGNKAIVKLLLDAGADINARDLEFHATPAGWAIEYLRQCEALLGIEIEDAQRAILNGDVALVQRYLLRFPALRGARDKDGTPLEVHARNSGNPALARLFRA